MMFSSAAAGARALRALACDSGSTDRCDRDLYWSVDDFVPRQLYEDEKARREQLENQVAELTKQVAQLAERLNRNSSNSSKPPSSDPPANRAARRAAAAKNRSGKKRGGQPGHEGSQRALVPPEEVDKFHDYFPEQCENCWKHLPETPDPHPWRYQTTEFPPVEPWIEEHRVHCVASRVRGAITRRERPSSVRPRSGRAFGE